MDNITRKLSSNEKMIIREDIKELILFCLKHDLINENFKERYQGLNIYVSSIPTGPGAGGVVDHIEKKIGIREAHLSDDFMRKTILYHEIGHILFDYDAMISLDQKTIKEKILSDITTNSTLKDINPLLCLTGFKLIQEYIAEKFNTLAVSESLEKPVEMRKDRTCIISGDYKYNTTFHSNYGLVETICDNLFNKAYKDIFEILNMCLNSTFYINLFAKYDNEELIKILEDFGKIYNMLDRYSTKKEVTNIEEAKKVLGELTQKVASIKTISNVSGYKI